MTREIKFRAWDKPNKRMCYFNNGFIQNNEYDIWHLDAVNDCDNICDVPCEDNIELMQFTGLKDKNGKEIYEGDIIKDDENYQGVVEWNEDYVGWNYYDKHVEEHLDFQCVGENHLEVIGNIYENKELIE